MKAGEVIVFKVRYEKISPILGCSLLVGFIKLLMRMYVFGWFRAVLINYPTQAQKKAVIYGRL